MSPAVLRPRARALALAALVVAVAIGAVLGPVALHFLRQQHEHRAEFERLARATLHAREHMSVAAAVRELGSRELWSGIYVNLSAAQASAAFAADLRSALGPHASGAAIEPLTDQAQGSIVEIGAHASWSASAAELAEALAGIERAPHWLRVRSLKVTSPTVQRNDRNEPLSVELEVVGFRMLDAWTPPT